MSNDVDPASTLACKHLQTGKLLFGESRAQAVATPTLHLVGSTQHTTLRLGPTRTVPGHAGGCAVDGVTAVATPVAPPRRVAWTVHGVLRCPRPWPTGMASLRAPVPLLAQELLEFVHHLLRVEVVLAPWARHIPGRIIVVL